MRISDWSSDVCSSDLASSLLSRAACLARTCHKNHFGGVFYPYPSSSKDEIMKQRINTYQNDGDAIAKLVGLNEALTEPFALKLRHIIDIRVSVIERKSKRLNSSHQCATRRQASA